MRTLEKKILKLAKALLLYKREILGGGKLDI